jgi:hypothetical protein
MTENVATTPTCGNEGHPSTGPMHESSGLSVAMCAGYQVRCGKPALLNAATVVSSQFEARPTQRSAAPCFCHSLIRNASDVRRQPFRKDPLIVQSTLPRTFAARRQTEPPANDDCALARVMSLMVRSTMRPTYPAFLWAGKRRAASGGPVIAPQPSPSIRLQTKAPPSRAGCIEAHGPLYSFAEPYPAT